MMTLNGNDAHVQRHTTNKGSPHHLYIKWKFIKAKENSNIQLEFVKNILIL